MLLAIVKGSQACSHVEHHIVYCNDGILSANLREFGTRAHKIGPSRIRNPLSVLLGRKRFIKLVEGLRPSLVVFHDSWSQLIFGKIVAKKKIGLVRMFHSLASQKTGLFERLSNLIQLDGHIANSMATKSSLEVSNPRIAFKVCYPPLPWMDLSTKGERRRRVRAEMKVGPGVRVILIAGRFEEYKGHRVLFQALSMLKKSAKWECWIAGEGQRPSEIKYKQGLELLGNELDIGQNLRWLGHVDKMVDLYAAADVYCQPNTSPESFGMTFVEAQSMNCPVVTTAFGGALETVKAVGGNQLLDIPSPSNVKKALGIILGISG